MPQDRSLPASQYSRNTQPAPTHPLPSNCPCIFGSLSLQGRPVFPPTVMACGDKAPVHAVRVSACEQGGPGVGGGAASIPREREKAVTLLAMFGFAVALSEGGFEQLLAEVALAVAFVAAVHGYPVAVVMSPGTGWGLCCQVHRCFHGRCVASR